VLDKTLDGYLDIAAYLPQKNGRDIFARMDRDRYPSSIRVTKLFVRASAGGLL